MAQANQAARIGMLCWETGQVPTGLRQLETLVGNSTNPATYAYPVRFKPVRGANACTILENPDRTVLQTMIADAQALVAEGARAITTSCGFNAIFQHELAAAVKVPVFTSSLLQVPLVRQVHGPDCEIGILTANAGALRPEHLSQVGIVGTAGLHILGLERCAEWRRIFSEPDAEIDLARIEQEVVGTARRACADHPNLRAFVLECTDLPPFSATIRRETGLPVFDVVTMIDYLHSSL